MRGRTGLWEVIQGSLPYRGNKDVFSIKQVFSSGGHVFTLAYLQGSVICLRSRYSYSNVSGSVRLIQIYIYKKNSEVEEEKTELPTGWSQVQLVISLYHFLIFNDTITSLLKN